MKLIPYDELTDKQKRFRKYDENKKKKKQVEITDTWTEKGLDGLNAIETVYFIRLMDRAEFRLINVPIDAGKRQKYDLLIRKLQ